MSYFPIGMYNITVLNISTCQIPILKNLLCLILINTLKGIISIMSKFIHNPTGKVYNNRKEAKLDMGYTNYNRALKNREFTFYKEN